MNVADDADLARVFRAEWGRSVAILVRVLGDIDLAEDAVQEAFGVAAQRWPQSGLPANPGGWITTTARRRAIDRLRREALRSGKQAEAVALMAGGGWDEPAGPMGDDRLRLIFTCCHPALAQPAQVALTLRLICGLEMPEIARAFLVTETTMSQRLLRAKNKIKAARIPYRIPADAELPDRLPPVLAAVYLTFSEGHTATAGDDLVRADVCAEAIRLARLLAELMPDEPEVIGLLALLLLTESRRAARTAPDGAMVLLPDQDRTRWDATLIAEGQALVRACLRRGRPGTYQIQAAINAVHSDAATAGATDWRQILRLYDQLLVVAPTPVVELNRVVALAEVHGLAVALAALDPLALADYRPYHVVRGSLLSRLGRPDEAAQAYRSALVLNSNDAERDLVERTLGELESAPAPST